MESRELGDKRLLLYVPHKRALSKPQIPVLSLIHIGPHACSLGDVGRDWFLSTSCCPLFL